MEDREQKIQEFAEKHNLTQAEAVLVYADGTEENIAANYALLQEIKTGKVHDDDQVRQSDLQKQAQELIAKADEMLAKGNVEASIRLRRQAHGMK